MACDLICGSRLALRGLCSSCVRWSHSDTPDELVRHVCVRVSVQQGGYYAAARFGNYAPNISAEQTAVRRHNEIRKYESA